MKSLISTWKSYFYSIVTLKFHNQFYSIKGRRCDRCKRGFFALHEAHSRGCLECFCNGITDQCEAANFGIEVLQHNEGWKVSDLRGRVLTDPYWSTVTHGITVAEEDMRGLQTYYWQAPEAYIGNHLVAYGLQVGCNFKILGIRFDDGFDKYLLAKN